MYVGNHNYSKIQYSIFDEFPVRNHCKSETPPRQDFHPFYLRSKSFSINVPSKHCTANYD